MFRPLIAALIGAAMTGAAAAEIGPPRKLSASDVLAEAARTGSVVGPATVEEDLDLGRLVGPAEGAPVAFQNINFRGRLVGAPKVPVSVVEGSICAIEAERSEWTRPADFRTVKVGSARFREARLSAAWTCLECTICRAGFQGTRFGNEATFIRTQFGEPAEGICPGPAPRTCAPSDFAEATFASAARFDHTTFRTPASFDSADFAQGARFPRTSATESLSFIGTHFRHDAEFRDCRLASVYFGPDSANTASTTNEATGFATRADFRGCVFTGTVSFNGAMFEGDALFARTVAAGRTFSLLDTSSARTLDLRGLVLSNPEAKLRLDAIAADAVRLDWDELGPAVLRAQDDLTPDQRASMLEALERRLTGQGDGEAARKVGFEAKKERRAHRPLCGGEQVGACAVGEAEWWLWTLPTRNGSDPTWLVVGLLLLWGSTTLAAAGRGRILVFPRGNSGDEAPAIYDCVAQDQAQDGTSCPIGSRRLRIAAGYATGLIFKLGARQQRFASASPRHRAVASGMLWTIWLLSWALLVLTAKVIVTAFPGLDFIKAG
jgi:hypothetical protein